ncbi:hypothetical protein ABT154_00560 [Streptomyces sp. NPDC001728]|uniref:hypothetical protein n=1 Tax=Streptomyces sp. NPDC001728 TaxID=3154396 RepID=UPI00332ECBDB
MTVTGVVLLVAAVGVGVLRPGEWATSVVSPLVGLGIVALVIGVGARSLAPRIRHALGTGAWSAHAAVPVARTWHAATVVLSDPDSGEMWPLTVVTTRQRYERVRPGPDGVLWWCGDPRTGGVLSPPGGGELVWAKPVRGGAARRRIVERAVRAGLPHRAVPLSPQRPVAADGPLQVPAGRPAAPLASAGALAAQKARPRRRWGLWRWVLLAGAVALGLGIYGVEAADDDRQIDLTVLSKQADGHCTVSWEDPFGGGTRTGPYRCTKDLDPVLEGWDTGFVVSYGPWKGDLYNADWEGAPANKVNEAFGMSGLLLLPVGLVGGAVGRWRRTRAVPVPYVSPAGAPPVNLVKAGHAPAAETPPSPTYAVLAAHAGRQAVPQTRTRRPEADVREVVWWRVRGLGRGAGVHETLILGAALVVAVYAIGVITLGKLLRAGYLLLTSGRHAARMLARAATAPVPVDRRYVLLHAPYGDVPVLVLFPAHGGADDLPEALLELLPPGTRKHPRAGLPSEPTGRVELRGWLDRVDDGRAVVVPWIEGRPLWPAEPYREAGGAEFTALLDRLAPPATVRPEAGDGEAGVQNSVRDSL